MTILITEEMHPFLEQALVKKGWQVVHDHKGWPARDLLEQVEAVVVRSRVALSLEMIVQMPRLRCVARAGAGLDNIDLQACKERNIEVVHAGEANSQSVAEHALGMILAWNKKLISGHNSILQGVWDREGHRGIELSGSTVGIIGLGNTGSALARLLSSFNCMVLAYDKYKEVKMAGVKAASLAEIQSSARIISFHVPLTEETRGMVDSGFFKDCLQKPLIVNTSRGGVLNTSHLVEALRHDQVRGACLDVLEVEGESLFQGAHAPWFRELCNFDSVLLSPHVAGWSVESYEKISKILFQKIVGIFP